MAEIPEPVEGKTGLVVPEQRRITGNRGALAGIEIQHGLMGKAPIDLVHLRIGADPVAIVEILAVGRVEVGIEEAQPVPAEGGEQKSGKARGIGQQRQHLGTGDLHPGQGGFQNAGRETNIVIGEQGDRRLGKAGEDQIPARGHPKVAEGPGHVDVVHQRMA